MFTLIVRDRNSCGYPYVAETPTDVYVAYTRHGIPDNIMRETDAFMRTAKPGDMLRLPRVILRCVTENAAYDFAQKTLIRDYPAAKPEPTTLSPDRYAELVEDVVCGALVDTAERLCNEIPQAEGYSPYPTDNIEGIGYDTGLLPELRDKMIEYLEALIPERMPRKEESHG